MGKFRNSVFATLILSAIATATSGAGEIDVLWADHYSDASTYVVAVPAAPEGSMIYATIDFGVEMLVDAAPIDPFSGMAAVTTPSNFPVALYGRRPDGPGVQRIRWLRRSRITTLRTVF